MRSKLVSKNNMSAISTFAVSVVRYPAAVVRWKLKNLKETDIETRKLMTMDGAFHFKSTTARLYTSKKEGGRRLHNIKTVVCQEEQSMKSYVSKKADSDPLLVECKRFVAT